jgi:hypothetical protein
MIGRTVATIAFKNLHRRFIGTIAHKLSVPLLANVCLCTLSLLTVERSWGAPVAGVSTIAQAFPPGEGQPQTPEMTASCTILTDKSISPEEMNLPTLWWVKEQYAAKAGFGERMIRSWSTFSNPERALCRVDVVVNRQLWSLLDYLQRYEFVNQVGYEFVNQMLGLAEPPKGIYRYGVRFFDRTPNGNEIRPVAFYGCIDRAAMEASTTPSLKSISCRIGPATFNQSGFRSTPIDE